MISQRADPREKPAYSEYPLTLAHPGFSPSVPEPIPGTQVYGARGELLRQDYRGTPQRLPPVTVNDANEEEYWSAQGYERAGKIDPSAWVRAHSDAPPANYVPQKYPMWKNGVLIMTAQEDPEATSDDLAPQPAAAPITPAPAPIGEADNLRAQLEEANRTMAALVEQQRALAEDNNRLRAERAASTQKRPRKTPAAE